MRSIEAVKTENSPNDQDLAIHAVAWFSALMHAKSKSKFKEAAVAKEKLEELGILIRFRKRRMT